MNDPIPSGSKFFSSTTSLGNCTHPPVGFGGTLSCKLGNMNKGDIAIITLVVNVKALAGTTIGNTANVGAATFDPIPANNSVTITTNVN